jgi:hypothetical protein
VNHEGVAVVDQAIEDRGNEDVVAKDGTPLSDDLVGGDQHACESRSIDWWSRLRQECRLQPSRERFVNVSTTSPDWKRGYKNGETWLARSRTATRRVGTAG